MSQQIIAACLFVLTWSTVCVQAQNCTVKCTSCASDNSSDHGIKFNVTVCAEQCAQSLDNGPMWRYCMEIGTWRKEKDEPTGKPRNTGLKWQYILAITLSVMFIVVSILAVMYCAWRNCRNPVADNRLSYRKESIALDEEETFDPV
ncbi:uncharacterized protein LOC118430991 [Branchiostoma floridae]|uniref:Uncharacterized protein LOC118430991 n=1 Tax=Branchiostoma floridae TaxID=7739 RepID=A0A9J7MBM2_BRAFL|nr:uncharacterized protein LOC118430991 [Branchiostoma floridae]XP_035697929.1 uncharacterized protein LOC118430991 [Branchiostoma floridae]